VGNQIQGFSPSMAAGDIPSAQPAGDYQIMAESFHGATKNFMSSLETITQVTGRLFEAPPSLIHQFSDYAADVLSTIGIPLTNQFPGLAGALTESGQHLLSVAVGLKGRDHPLEGLPLDLARLAEAGAPHIGMETAREHPTTPLEKMQVNLAALRADAAATVPGGSPTGLVDALNRLVDMLPVNTPTAELSRLTSQGLTFTHSLRDGNFQSAMNTLQEAVHQQPGDPLIDQMTKWVQSADTFSSQVMDGQMANRLSRLVDALAYETDPQAVQAREIAQQGTRYFSDLSNGRLEQMLTQFGSELVKLATHPSVPSIADHFSQLGSVFQNLRTATGALGDKSLDPSLPERPPGIGPARQYAEAAGRFMAEATQGAFPEALTALAQSARELLNSPVLQQSLDLLHPAGTFMAFLKSGDFNKIMLRLKETAGDKTTIQTIIEDSIPASTQSGSFFRGITSDHFYHVMDQMYRRHEQPASTGIPFDKRVMDNLSVVSDSSRFLTGMLDGSFMKAVTQYGHQLNVTVNMGQARDLLPGWDRNIPSFGDSAEFQALLLKEFNNIQVASREGKIHLPGDRELFDILKSPGRFRDNITRSLRA